MSLLQHTIDTSEPHDAARYWMPCLGVALVAISLFYVTLKDLVHESAARVPAPPPAVMPAHVEAARPADPPAAPAVPVSVQPPVRLTNAGLEAPAALPAEMPTETPAKAVPAVTEVHKCVMPEGGAIYSDAPCPEGTHARTLRLPRELHASVRQ